MNFASLLCTLLAFVYNNPCNNNSHNNVNNGRPPVSFTSKPTSRYCPYGRTGKNCQDECGITSTEQNSRIVGGSIAAEHSWPAMAHIEFVYAADVFIASLNRNRKYSVKYFCGGSLIDRQTILFAGHCVVNKVEFSVNTQTEDYTLIYNVTPNNYYPTFESMFTVYLGAQNLSSLDQPPVVKRLVSKVIRHEKYDPINQLNDIALLKLTEEVTLDENIQLACLPNHENQFFPRMYNIYSWAVGWGLTSEDGVISDQLKNVKLIVYDPLKCENVSVDTSKNWRSQICAGYLPGGLDTCQGDSGGPLYVLDKINNRYKYVLAGVTSYGDGCANQGLPGIYTRVSYFVDWINKNS